jgi:dihydrofolate synthase/folylpolyglutamate synthase
MLKGTYQRHNIDTFYTAIEALKRLGYLISWEAAHTALANVTKLTGLKGRWEKLQDNPTVICDTGHNAEAMPFLMEQLEADYKDLPKFFIWGMVTDKDRTRILSLLPKNAHYYLVKPGVARGYNAQQLQEEMLQMGFNALAFEHFSEAITHAKKEALTNGGIVFIGGSTFLVADALLAYTPA